MFNHYLTNTLRYDALLCINCGLCVAVCPHGVFAPNGKAVKLERARACMECGACQLNCPTAAIAVDSGVGCAAAMIWSALTGSKEVTCGDSGSSCCAGDVRDVVKALPGRLTGAAGKAELATASTAAGPACGCGVSDCASEAAGAT
jgi:NAD-dependent dihydropyrimidine dehydrogenase PreA subunit